MMLNQGESTDSIATLEKHQINDSQQVHTSYLSPNCAVASWNMQADNPSLRENGVPSTSDQNHDQNVEPTLNFVQDGSNVAPVVSTSSSVPANVAQGYSSYAAYPNTDHYGYSSTSYSDYYNHYQQQPIHHQLQASQYQQQSNQYQHQPNQYHQQPIQYQQQSTQSYPHQVGAYQTTGAPYQPLSSFQNTGSYAAPASYSSTYYNPGDYQTSGDYTSGSYGTQTNLWHEGQYATYSSHQYQNYSQDSNSACSSTSDVANLQYQQNYKQWEDYYNQTQTEVSCAPGTEKLPVSVGSSVSSFVLNGTIAYATPTNQMPTAYTPVWRPESSSSEMTSMQVLVVLIAYSYLAVRSKSLSWTQPIGVSGSTPDWKHGVSTFQNDRPNSVPPYAQKPPEVVPAYESFQNQQNLTFSQGSTAVYPASYQPIGVSGSTPDRKHGVSASHNDLANSVQSHAQKPPEAIPSYECSQNQQNPILSECSTAPYQVSHSSFQTVLLPSDPLDSRSASKMQIPTNPRIASNLPFSVSKNEKDSSVTSGVARPVYVSVPMQTLDKRVTSHEEADTMLKKPGMFPKSLRGYVERALARCKSDRQKTACQTIMKEVITKATADGTLYTKDWDIEPLFPMPNVDLVDKDDALFPIITSAMPKSRSPSRRAKSRWEPIPEEKMVHKSADISTVTPVHSGWYKKQVSGGKTENSGNFGSKFSLTYQKSFRKNVPRPAKRQRLGEDHNVADVGETSNDSDKEQSLTKNYPAAIALEDSPEEKKKREYRSKRFDKGHGKRAEKINFRAKDVGIGDLYARRASALVLSRTLEESSSRAVEDIDWNALTVKGTCQETEKRYLRLTSAPDPATVRPEEVLEKSLLMVQNSQKNYLYKCDQLKSIRQDLTVQHICNELTVMVYETHARLAIEVGDLAEYNQCQSQLKTLYAEGIMGCHMEFAAYNLLCVIMHSNNNRDLLSAMSRSVMICVLALTLP
ncbi:hypothetical protein OROMI_006742 [Orobanche minor]